MSAPVHKVVYDERRGMVDMEATIHANPAIRWPLRRLEEFRAQLVELKVGTDASTYAATLVFKAKWAYLTEGVTGRSSVLAGEAEAAVRAVVGPRPPPPALVPPPVAVAAAAVAPPPYEVAVSREVTVSRKEGWNSSKLYPTMTCSLECHAEGRAEAKRASVEGRSTTYFYVYSETDGLSKCVMCGKVYPVDIPSVKALECADKEWSARAR
jgi:hypothetical protein